MMSGSDYFNKYDIKAEELYDLEKFAEAIEFLEPAFEEFPEQYFFIAWRGFIVVYLQSSQLLSSAGSEWEGDFQQTQKDIRQCYDEIVADYAVDTEKVIASGFSGGASVSIDIALKDIFPVKGFIALGPDKPEGFSRELYENARQRGTRGVIMDGEETCNNPELQEMESVLKEVGFPYELTINKGIGHWYPDDLAEKVDKAITFILNE